LLFQAAQQISRLRAELILSQVQARNDIARQKQSTLLNYYVNRLSTLSPVPASRTGFRVTAAVSCVLASVGTAPYDYRQLRAKT